MSALSSHGRQVWMRVVGTRTGVHRMVVAFCLLFWGLRWIDGTLLMHISEAPLSLARTDRLFWWAHAAGIPFWLREYGVFWDLVLMGGMLFQFLFPKKRIWVALSGLGWLSLHLGYYSAYAYHSHVLLGMVFIHIPLLVLHTEKFGQLAWDGIRYYALFTYFSAAFWKLFRGTVSHTQHFADVVWLSRSDQWLGEPQNSRIPLEWLAGEGLWHAAWLGLVIWQLSFCAGLFTRKLDTYFALTLIGFHAFSSYFLNIPIGALAIYALVFIPLPANRVAK